jgi:Family of unknown function (DUF6165)
MMYKNPTVQVSWGELIDKMTILEIKEKRLILSEAVANVRRELTAVRMVVQNIQSEQPSLALLANELKAINEDLWEIEVKIRTKEAAKSFDQEFIELARSVYRRNDERAAIKREINKLLNSEIVEEKSYDTNADKQ